MLGLVLETTSEVLPELSVHPLPSLLTVVVEKLLESSSKGP